MISPAGATSGRALKLLVYIWVVSAVAVETILMAPGWRPIMWWSAGAFAVAVSLAFVTRRAMSAVLVFAYLYPAILYLLSGQTQVQFGVVWMAALLGALLPDGVRTGWHFPRPWRMPLLYWIFAIVVSASIVSARELDFTWVLVGVKDVSNSSIGGWPTFMVAWVVHVAVVLLLGLLWFDWLNGRPAGEFRETVVAPLVVSVVAAACVSLYQAFADSTFLNPTVYAAIGRTTGGLLDANATGTIAAMWIGGVLLFASRLPRGWRELAAGAGTAGAWLMVWTSGSRTALAAALIVSAGSAYGIWSAGRRRGLGASWRLIAVACAAVLIAVVLGSRAVGISGPIRRLWSGGFEGRTSLPAIAAELWNRNGYGAAATLMIADHPAFGVGVGAFHFMVPDYGRRLRRPLRKPDNAQNWYRHQVAEFGVVGSLGWMAWVAMFAAFVFRKARDAPAMAWAARAALIALAVISLLGMPAQELAVSLTFWTMAFWLMTLVGAPSPPGQLGRWSGVAAIVALTIFGVGTARLAAGSLRVPARAQRIGWPYSYGLYDTELDADGNPFRWTARHAVAVFHAPARQMDLTVSVNHPDLASQPVHARVWCDGTLVVDANLADSKPVTSRVSLPETEHEVMIETLVDHTERPSDRGLPDSRDLGLMVAWRFVGG